MARSLSAYGRDLIKRFEGLRLTAYPDGDGRYSIGYGHNGVPKGHQITKAEADRLFELDVQKFENAVNERTPSTTQNQFDALVSFAYNVGVGDEATGKGFKGSTLARMHNAGDYAGAAQQFARWINSEGKPNEVLKSRRETERALYAQGQHATPPTPTPPVTPPGLPPIGLPPTPILPPPPLAAGFAGGEIGWQWVLVPVFFWPSVRADGCADAEAEGGGLEKMADKVGG